MCLTLVSDISNCNPSLQTRRHYYRINHRWLYGVQIPYNPECVAKFYVRKLNIRKICSFLFIGSSQDCWIVDSVVGTDSVSKLQIFCGPPGPFTKSSVLRNDGKKSLNFGQRPRGWFRDDWKWPILHFSLKHRFRGFHSSQIPSIFFGLLFTLRLHTHTHTMVCLRIQLWDVCVLGILTWDGRYNGATGE